MKVKDLLHFLENHVLETLRCAKTGNARRTFNKICTATSISLSLVAFLIDPHAMYDEYHCRVVSTPSSYSRSPGFNFYSEEDYLFRLIFFVDLLSVPEVKSHSSRENFLPKSF